jgi:hypothetical protein
MPPAHATTIREFLIGACERERTEWIGMWVPWQSDCSSVTIRRENQERPIDVYTLEAVCPRDVVEIGLTGLLRDETTAWIGFDFDCGHGPKSFATTADAIAAAIRLHSYLQGVPEIRLSKGGRGVHVRYSLPKPLPHADAIRLAKRLDAQLELHSDRAVLGRQVLISWTREHSHPDAFKLIRPSCFEVDHHAAA